MADMKPRPLTDVDVLARLETAIAESGSTLKFAKRYGVSPTLVSYVRRRLMPIPPKILKALQLERCPTTYREKP